MCETVSLLKRRTSLTWRCAPAAGAATTVTGVVPFELRLLFPKVNAEAVLSAHEVVIWHCRVVMASPRRICRILEVVSRFTLHPPRGDGFDEREAGCAAAGRAGGTSRSGRT